MTGRADGDVMADGSSEASDSVCSGLHGGKGTESGGFLLFVREARHCGVGIR